jgi:hypothetical protein
MVKTTKKYRVYEITADGLVKVYSDGKGYFHNVFDTEEEAIASMESEIADSIWSITIRYTVLPFYESSVEVEPYKPLKSSTKKKSKSKRA